MVTNGRRFSGGAGSTRPTHNGGPRLNVFAENRRHTREDYAQGDWGSNLRGVWSCMKYELQGQIGEARRGCHRQLLSAWRLLGGARRGNLPCREAGVHWFSPRCGSRISTRGIAWRGGVGGGGANGRRRGYRLSGPPCPTDDAEVQGRRGSIRCSSLRARIGSDWGRPEEESPMRLGALQPGATLR